MAATSGSSGRCSVWCRGWTVVTMIAATATALGQHPWPAFGGPDGGSRRATHGSQSFADGTVRWSKYLGPPPEYDSLGESWSKQVIVADANVVIAVEDGRLRGYNGDSGELLWESSAVRGATVRQPLVIGTNGIVVTASSEPFEILAFDSVGQFLWRQRLQERTASSPIFGTDGLVYYGALYHQFGWFNLTSGTVAGWDRAWTVQPSTLAVTDDSRTLYVASRILGHVTSYPTTYDNNNYEPLHFTDIGPVQGAPVIAGGLLLVGSDDHKLHAIRRSDSLRVWAFSTGGRVQTTPTLNAGGTAAFIGSDDGSAYAVRVSDGQMLWNVSTRGAVRSNPAIDDGGRVFFGSDAGVFHAVAAVDGRPLWNISAGAMVRSSPATTSGLVVFGSHNGVVYAANASTGKVRWIRILGGAVRSGLATDASGRVFVGSDARTLHVFNATTGDELWNRTVDSGVDCAIAVDADRDAVCVTTPGMFLHCFRASRGDAIASTVIHGPLPVFLSLAGDDRVVGTTSGTVSAVRVSDGTLEWERSAGNDVYYAPAVVGGSDGVVVERTDAQYTPRNVKAFNVTDGRLQWDFAAGDIFSPVVGSVEATQIITMCGVHSQCGLDARTGTKLWQSYASPWTDAAAIGRDGTVYGVDYTSVRATTWGSSAVVWETEMSDSVSRASVAIGTDGTLYVNAGTNGFQALRPGDGSVIWVNDSQSWWGPPAIGSDGTVYVRSSGGWLHAFAGSPGAAPSPQPSPTPSSSPSPSPGASAAVPQPPQCIVGNTPDCFLAVVPFVVIVAGVVVLVAVAAAIFTDGQGTKLSDKARQVFTVALEIADMGSDIVYIHSRWLTEPWLITFVLLPLLGHVVWLWHAGLLVMIAALLPNEWREDHRCATFPGAVLLLLRFIAVVVASIGWHALGASLFLIRALHAARVARLWVAVLKRQVVSSDEEKEKVHKGAANSIIIAHCFLESLPQLVIVASTTTTWDATAIITVTTSAINIISVAWKYTYALLCFRVNPLYINPSSPHSEVSTKNPSISSRSEF